MFEFFNIPYYLIIGLQGICVFHCVKKGNQNKWIWIIVCLPLIGSLIYIFSEILTKREIGNVQSNLNTIEKKKPELFFQKYYKKRLI
jgi:hypothetical protein